jgi:lysophospholipase L1-like esterase
LSTVSRRQSIGLAAALLAGPGLADASPAARPKQLDPLTPRFPKGTRILFQGDSITDGGRGRGPDPNHIFGQDYAYLVAAQCGAHFPDENWTFLNRGISGNKVTDLAARWQTDTLDLKPDILSVLVGVNDASSMLHDPATGVSAERYEEVYDQILGLAVAANPALKIVLGQPFLVPISAAQGTQIKRLQAAIERVAAKYHAPVIPYQTVLDAAVARSSQPADYWVWDTVHPTYAGHQLMAEAWLLTVNEFYFKR